MWGLKFQDLCGQFLATRLSLPLVGCHGMLLTPDALRDQNGKYYCEESAQFNAGSRCF